MALMDEPVALPPEVRPLRRAAILIRDLGRSLALYQDALETTFGDFDGALVNLIEAG
jgi:hypothetical protein